MKKSSGHTILQIYSVFFLAFLGAILAAIGLFLLLITIRKPDGTIVMSDWPITFTEDFREQIIVINGEPQVKQAGLALLQDNQIGLQIIDSMGNEAFVFQEPEAADAGTSLMGTVDSQGNDYTYILHFPVDIRTVTMYLNGERFTGGKTVILTVAGILLLVMLAAAVAYGFWTAKSIGRLVVSIREISRRSYLPLRADGAFGDLYDSLNVLDMEIRTSDSLQKETECMRREWIANITHDLKTPLSPIRGYSELLSNNVPKSEEQCRRYAEIILKNVTYMEKLVDDLKLTYQLENGMVPVNRQEQNLVRFLRELVIGVLNRPEYESRCIQFESTDDTILYSFDGRLLTRAFQNLLINAFVHGDVNTKITLQITSSENGVKIIVNDNGKGMTAEEAKRIFERYYRGANTERKPEGTGLGLAIAKNIVELHGGTLSVSSIPGIGTTFLMSLPAVKVN